MGALRPEATADALRGIRQLLSTLVAIDGHQLRDPFLGRPSNFKHLRCLHLLKQIPGDAASTDLGTFRFEPDFLGTGMAVLI